MNKGYTGDWFLEPISELVPAPALQWQYHCFAPFAAFIDQEDGRYLKNPKIFSPGESHIFNLLGVNDSPSGQSGSLSVKVIDIEGVEVFEETIGLSIAAHFEEHISVNVLLPEKTGGYLLVSELTDSENSTQISRRYIRVGTVEEKVEFPELKIEPPVKPNTRKSP
jgi:hypothetical protein